MPLSTGQFFSIIYNDGQLSLLWSTSRLPVLSEHPELSSVTVISFTFKTKLRHLIKKWYPGGVQLMHTVIRYYLQLTLSAKQASK